MIHRDKPVVQEPVERKRMPISPQAGRGSASGTPMNWASKGWQIHRRTSRWGKLALRGTRKNPLAPLAGERPGGVRGARFGEPSRIFGDLYIIAEIQCGDGTERSSRGSIVRSRPAASNPRSKSGRRSDLAVNEEGDLANDLGRAVQERGLREHLDGVLAVLENQVAPIRQDDGGRERVGSGVLVPVGHINRLDSARRFSLD